MSNGKFELTEQELKIAQLISQGFTNEMIHKKLVLEKTTVRTHLSNIYHKLNLTNNNIDRGTMRVRIALFIINNKLDCKGCIYKTKFNLIKKICNKVEDANI